MGDKTLTFGVSGDLYDSNLLMYDHETQSEWLQITGQAVEGPLRGTILQPYPVAYDTWAHWKAEHPNGLVLSIDNGYQQVFGYYETSPYAGYDSTPTLFFYVNRDNKLLPRKTRVIGVVVNGAEKAYEEQTVWKLGAIADRVGGVDVTILADRASSRLGAFPSDGHVFSLVQGQVRDDRGRLWSWEGDELSAGDVHLRSFPVLTTFWFAWSAIHPKTDLFKS